jgi:hypothetical protein
MLLFCTFNYVCFFLTLSQFQETTRTSFNFPLLFSVNFCRGEPVMPREHHLNSGKQHVFNYDMPEDNNTGRFGTKVITLS